MLTSQSMGAALVAVIAAGVLAGGSAPAAWNALDRASEAACRSASGLSGEVQVGPPARFSDDRGVDARIVTGVASQPHMAGQAQTLLCLYHRTTGQAEVQELPMLEDVGSAALFVPGSQWRIVEVNGRPTVADREATLGLAEGGLISGSTGCNRFSGRFRVEGGAMVTSPMATTRMACMGPVEAQERDILAVLTAQPAIQPGPGGAVRLQSQDGGVLLLRPIAVPE
jgi:heat shock protein HslJ